MAGTPRRAAPRGAQRGAAGGVMPGTSAGQAWYPDLGAQQAGDQGADAAKRVARTYMAGELAQDVGLNQVVRAIDVGFRKPVWSIPYRFATDDPSASRRSAPA